MASSTNNNAREMGFNLFDGRDDWGHSGVGLVEISKLFTVQGDLTEYSSHLRLVFHLL